MGSYPLKRISPIDVSHDAELARQSWANHPLAPLRGERGGGGFVGWANRLDLRLGARKSAAEVQQAGVRVTTGDVLRELIRPPLVVATIAWFALQCVLVVVLPVFGGTVGLLVFFAVLERARRQARKRRLAEMRRERGGL